MSTISGVFDEVFWKEVVVQAAGSEPALKHAMVALSSIFEGVESSDSLTQQRLAWEQCNKAIKLLLQQRDPPKAVMLVAAALFMYLEIFQGHLASAMSHMRSAFQILADQGASGLDPRLVRIFEALFTDIILVCAPYSRSSAESWLFGNSRDFKMPLVLRTPEQARHALFQIIALRRQPDTRTELEAMVAKERRSLAGWIARLDTSSHQDPDLAISMLIIKAIGLTSLPVYHAYSAQDQCIFDLYQSEYEAAFEIFQTIYNHEISRTQEGRTPQWSRLRSIHGAMSVVMLCCRDPVTRRRTIELTRKIYRRNGYLDHELPSAADLCELIMMVEEAGATIQPVMKASDIPEMARVSLSSKVEPVETGGTAVRWVRYPYDDDGPYEEGYIPTNTVVPDSDYVSGTFDESFDIYRHSPPSNGKLVQFYSALKWAMWKASLQYVYILDLVTGSECLSWTDANITKNRDLSTNATDLMIRAAGIAIERLTSRYKVPKPKASLHLLARPR